MYISVMYKRIHIVYLLMDISVTIGNPWTAIE